MIVYALVVSPLSGTNGFAKNERRVDRFRSRPTTAASFWLPLLMLLLVTLVKETTTKE